MEIKDFEKFSEEMLKYMISTLEKMKSLDEQSKESRWEELFKLNDEFTQILRDFYDKSF